MTHLKGFIATMEKASQSDPMMQRWLYGTKELERQLSERLIRLCKYPDMIPKEVILDYATILFEAIEEAKKRKWYIFSVDLLKSLIEFVEIIEKSENPHLRVQGERIREIIIL